MGDLSWITWATVFAALCISHIAGIFFGAALARNAHADDCRKCVSATIYGTASKQDDKHVDKFA